MISVKISDGSIDGYEKFTLVADSTSTTSIDFGLVEGNTLVTYLQDLLESLHKEIDKLEKKGYNYIVNS